MEFYFFTSLQVLNYVCVVKPSFLGTIAPFYTSLSFIMIIIKAGSVNFLKHVAAHTQSYALLSNRER